MSDAQKTPLSRTLTTLATVRALDEIKKRGAALPGHVVSVSGSVVTVAFDLADVQLHQVTIPVIGAEYVRLPIQSGDKGEAWPGSVYLGGVSGLGSGTADLATLRGNLSALIWVPVGSKSWPSVDGSKLTLYGPNGGVLRDSNSKAVIDVDATNGITMSFGGHSIQINSTGVSIDGKVFLTHEHTLVQPGTGVSGPVK